MINYYFDLRDLSALLWRLLPNLVASFNISNPDSLRVKSVDQSWLRPFLKLGYREISYLREYFNGKNSTFSIFKTTFLNYEETRKLCEFKGYAQLPVPLDEKGKNLWNLANPKHYPILTPRRQTRYDLWLFFIKYFHFHQFLLAEKHLSSNKKEQNLAHKLI